MEVRWVRLSTVLVLVSGLVFAKGSGGHSHAVATHSHAYPSGKTKVSKAHSPTVKKPRKPRTKKV